MNKTKIKGKLIVALLLIGTIVAFFLIDERVEQTSPSISLNKELTQWNTRAPIEITLKDKSGIRNYEVVFFDGKKEHILKSFANSNDEIITKVSFNVTGTKELDVFKSFNNTYLQIVATDNSKWNFTLGNKAVKKINLKIDTKMPIASVLANSKHIKRGGSALAVVRVEDDNLEDAYVLLNKKDRFELYPYKKEGYYLVFLAWDIYTENFNGARLIVVDKAGNKVSRKIPFWVQEFTYRKRKITIKDDFIELASTEALEYSREVVPSDLKARFLAQNGMLRAKNYNKMKEVINKLSHKKLIKTFGIKPFKRLKGSSKVSHFADYRTYYYKKRKIDKQWHLGIDWVAFPKNRVQVGNVGKVIYNDYLGIYGNTVLVDHNFGITSMYAHLSLSSVELNDKLKVGSKIGNTGSSGASFGDHLHFSMLVQGVLVDPKEWMDKKWIKERFYNVIKKAKKIMK